MLYKTCLTNVVVHAYADRDPGPTIVEAWPDEAGIYGC
jgi:anti-sigma regulatory factor (Ser/Thr protein kinase)